MRRRGRFALLLRWCIAGALCLWISAALSIVVLRWVAPPFTAVHVQRRIQARLHGKPYHKQYLFVPLARVALEFQHAVVAAEDASFYRHHGFDWREIRIAVEEDPDERRIRGASTITQQLVKNLFFGTGRSFLRKGLEATLVPVAELALGKQRILELYLNVVEWGPGVYGAEAAAQALLLDGGTACQPWTGAAACRHSARSPETAAGANDELQRADRRTHAPDGLVISAGMGRLIPMGVSSPGDHGIPSFRNRL